MIWARLFGAVPPRRETFAALPVFPLDGVLFPGGLMRLTVTVPAYRDMVAGCLQERTPFGVCLIGGGETVEPAIPPHAPRTSTHAIGTLAHIECGEMSTAGQETSLNLVIRGGRRVCLRSRSYRPNGLTYAAAECLDEPADRALCPAHRQLLPLLMRVVGDLGPEKIPEPYRYEDAAWVGYRLCEILPVQALAKQKLLELDDPAARLDILQTYLAQRGLLG